MDILILIYIYRNADQNEILFLMFQARPGEIAMDVEINSQIF